MMNTKSMGAIDAPSRSTIPLRTVSITSPPASTAPPTSDAATTISACFIDRVPAPTDVPKEFATSFPPMLKAMNKPKVIVTANTA